MGRLTSIVFVLIATVALACGDLGVGEDAQKMAREAKAMSLLKQYQVAQALYKIEGWGADYGYGSLGDLRDRGEGIIDGELFGAWDRTRNATPVEGYLFADIQTDRQHRAGLCAYPSDPEMADTMILMLLDDSDPDEWAFYKAPFASVGNPVRKWPSAATLSKSFERVRKTSVF